MKKDIKIFLEHILESISLIEEYVKGKDKSDFLESTLKLTLIFNREKKTRFGEKNKQ